MEKETIEKAKIRIYKDYWNVEHTQWIKSNFLNGFEEGAKWQQEQDKKMYSEEEVIKLLEKRDKYVGNWLPPLKWLEQFKNK